MLSAGNDSQFATLCSPAVLNKPDWLNDDRFSSNHKRVEHRDAMIALIEEVLSEKTTEEWCQKLLGKGQVCLSFLSPSCANAADIRLPFAWVQARADLLQTHVLAIRPINNIAQTFSHPQAIAREVVEEVVVSLQISMRLDVRLTVCSIRGLVRSSLQHQPSHMMVASRR